jgi:hypothetical protein
MLQSVAGSLACFVGGLACALPLLWYYRGMGLLRGPPAGPAVTAERLLSGAVLCSAVGAVAESFPLADDNIAIVVAVSAAARIYFGF